MLGRQLNCRPNMAGLGSFYQNRCYIIPAWDFGCREGVVLGKSMVLLVSFKRARWFMLAI
jgi:hypothetical protein